eukprot:CAMPEP_0177649060 /NCGR_PEP_ID=MMETSP0447-20121125/11166_1 /TAXON_ID=0 /ORGANISM="Stygamoeba regulata, Strain BSH-02190019" /LENGTH=125 /DNA_ID=CAMNT_0019151755 /DNA_START=127 /DNA_END=504 /DNA_ORIENTATION=-
MSTLRSGTLVGTDSFGNKYFENQQESEYGRHRWVEYNSGSFNYDPTTVSSEWHAWLHYTSDVPPTSAEFQKLRPTYEKKHIINQTGTEQAYHPHNYILNESWRPVHQRASKVEVFTPDKMEEARN